MMSKWSEKVGELLDDIEKDNRIALRDQFATAVLQGLCAQSQVHAMSHRPEDTASKAYRLADAMLAQREAGQ